MHFLTKVKVHSENFEILLVGVIALCISIVAIAFTFSNNYILSYGDAESHINIAKRVVDSLTPGAAQLGGIWLPLPHILMIPFIEFDPLWRTGLAGSIVSGLSFVLTCIFIYKFVYLITKNKVASFFGFLIFAVNPNVLYLQSVPMTEMVFICFYVISIYYFLKYLTFERTIFLFYTSLFAFLASLTRYDGWFLVIFEAGLLALFTL